MAGWKEDALTLTRVWCNIMFRCSSRTSLGSLSCCTYTQLCSVYNELRHFLIWNGLTLNFALTSSCLRLISVAGMIAAHRLCLLKVAMSPSGKKSHCCHIMKFIASLQDSHYATRPVGYLRCFTLRLIDKNFTWSTKSLMINYQSSINHAIP